MSKSAFVTSGETRFLPEANESLAEHKPIMFVVVSDDPRWCECELRGDDVVVIRN